MVKRCKTPTPTAIHESGHAVAALACGAKVTMLTATGAGSCRVPDLKRLSPRRRILVALAGALAADQWCDDPGDAGVPSPRGGDVSVIEGALIELCESVYGEEYRAHLRRARQFVIDNGAAILFLAEALSRTGFVGEVMLSRLCREFRSPLAPFKRFYPIRLQYAPNRPPPSPAALSAGESDGGDRVRFFHWASDHHPNGRFEMIRRRDLPAGAVRSAIARDDGTYISAYTIPVPGVRGRRPATAGPLVARGADPRPWKPSRRGGAITAGRCRSGPGTGRSPGR
jgi:hypothetical protein